MNASTENLHAISSTPDRLETRLGTLEFEDGFPSPETSARAHDHLDYLHGVRRTTRS